jgi:flagellin
MANVDVTRIAGNIGALNALSALQDINSQLAIHQTRLATGKRLNEAADDPAGMSIATSFDVRRQGLVTVLGSIGDAKNMLATAEGGLKKVQDIMVKMRNKALEAVGDNLGPSERAAVDNQLQSYADEINAIVDQTQWNGTKLIGQSGSAAGVAQTTVTPMSFLTDVDGGATTFNLGQNFATGGSIAAGTGLGLTALATGNPVTNPLLDGAKIGIVGTTATSGTSAAAQSAVQEITLALNAVKVGISNIGALTARMSFKEEALTVQRNNTEAAYNRIMNADMAGEQVEASKYAILQQTSTAMLSQANSAPQFLLSLFK